MTNSKFLLPIHCDEKFFQLTLFSHRSVPMTCWYLKEDSTWNVMVMVLIDLLLFPSCVSCSNFYPYENSQSCCQHPPYARWELQGLILSVKRPWTRSMNQSYTCQENMVWNGKFQLTSLAIHTLYGINAHLTLFRLESPTWQQLGVPATGFRLTKTLFVILKGQKFETRCLANLTKTSVNLVEWYKT